LRFHIQGSIFASGLIFLGLIKIVTSFFKDSEGVWRFYNFVTADFIFALLIFLLGTYYHYKVLKKTPMRDLTLFLKFFVSRQMQKSLMTKFRRWCYNQKVNLTYALGKGRKRFLKSLNIRSNPDNFSKK